MTNHRDFKSLFKFKPIDQFLYQIFLDSEIYFSGRHRLNDPNEAILRFTKQKVEPKDPFAPFEVVDLSEPHFSAIDNQYFFCLTRDHQSVPLWGYYGDNHRGVCLEFDFSVAIPQWLDDPEKPWKVEAQAEVPFIDEVHYQDSLDEYVLAPDGHPDLTPDESDLFGFTKLKCWDQEREVRMRLTRNPSAMNEVMPQGIAWKIEKSWLKSIYFGVRADAKAKSQIASLTKAMGFDCRLFEGHDIIIQDDGPCVAFRPYTWSTP